jgi:type II secretory pathway component PulJ
MSARDDDIEFDFFDDEPETEQATQRRPALRPRPRTGDGGGGGSPPRRSIGPPQGFTPLLRLILLIALALFVVVLLVFWLQSCRADSRENAYRDYVEDMSAVARASDAIANDLNQQLTTPGIRQADLITAIEGLTRRQEQVVRNAQDLDPPGPLREEHEAAIQALEFRVSGLNGLALAFDETADEREASDAGVLLATQAERLVASDVIWDDLFKDPAREELENQGVSGVPVPDSNSIRSADLASQRSMVNLWERLQSAARGGTPTGLHGTSIVSTVVLPSGEELTTSGDNIVEASQDLAFRITVQNSGDGQEVGIDVTLTIQKAPEPIEKTATIDIINPGETKTVTFEDLGEPPLGPPTALKVTVAPVPGEARTDNNTSEYQVVFSFPR